MYFNLLVKQISNGMDIKIHIENTVAKLTLETQYKQNIILKICSF